MRHRFGDREGDAVLDGGSECDTVSNLELSPVVRCVLMCNKKEESSVYDVHMK